MGRFRRDEAWWDRYLLVDREVDDCNVVGCFPPVEVVPTLFFVFVFGAPAPKTAF
jgi:hypothetical protein